MSKDEIINFVLEAKERFLFSLCDVMMPFVHFSSSKFIFPLAKAIIILTWKKEEKLIIRLNYTLMREKEEVDKT